MWTVKKKKELTDKIGIDYKKLEALLEGDAKFRQLLSRQDLYNAIDFLVTNKIKI